MKTTYKLILICLGALVLRLVMLSFIRHPGIADPNHYYNVGRSLVNGRGFEIDYIWQYYSAPDSIVHSMDWWLPLTSVLAAVGMWLFGPGVQAALLAFILLGAVLPVLTYWAARQFGCTETASLFSAAVSAVLPEFYLNSLRTNTLIPNAVLVTGCILLLWRGLKHNDIKALCVGGVLAGLAYLTRSENIVLFPTYIVTLVVYAVVARPINQLRWWAIILPPIIALGIVNPWLLRNQQQFGWLAPPNQQRILFWTDIRDQYTYEPEFNWETLRAQQSMRQIINKRVFEIAASIKIMYTALDVFLPVAVLGGMLWLIVRRDRERLLMLTPPLIMLVGIFFIYTVLMPFLSQGGSFKKAYLSLVPLFIPVGAYAVEQAVPNDRLRMGTMGIVLLLMSMNAIEMMRADIRFTNNFLARMEQVVDVLHTLPDTNGDQEIVLMNQDQFMLSFLGIKSVAIPMDDRETILEVAQRYHVDYLLMPPARPALDPLYIGTETDRRFVPVHEIQGTEMVIYGFGTP